MQLTDPMHSYLCHCVTEENMNMNQTEKLNISFQSLGSSLISANSIALCERINQDKPKANKQNRRNVCNPIPVD